MPHQNRRKPRGSAIVEGVVALALIIGATVLATLLLLNVGGATYNKEKIGFVATQAANYASTLPADAARQGLVTDLVDQLLASMGFGSSTTVSIADLTVGTRQAVKVTVSASLPTLMSSNFANVMPSQIQMSDSAIAIDNAWMWGYGVGTLPTGQKFTVPLINATGALPSDSLPAYGVSIVGMGKNSLESSLAARTKWNGPKIYKIDQKQRRSGSCRGRSRTSDCNFRNPCSQQYCY